jgi:membrane dipeptidase
VHLPVIVDAHLDLAYNVQSNKRDLARSVHATRLIEADSERLQHTGESTVGWPELVRGRVGIVFGTLFVSPASHKVSPTDLVYADPKEAHALAMWQLDWYRRMADEKPNVALVTTQSALRDVLGDWGLGDKPHAPGTRHRVGIVPLMEGAEPILEPKELERWYEKGVRIVGPAWDTTRYAGGTWQKGRLPKLGRELFEVMARFDVALDVAHMSHETLFEAVDVFEGKHMIASHCNPARFVPHVNERHLPDPVIERIAARGGVIGVVLYNRFLKKDWSSGKDAVTLDDVIRMIDHICQLTGSAAHVGIGSDYDGGLGRLEIPRELDSVRDHYKIGEELLRRGYREDDVAGIMYGNWLAFLKRLLPN